MTEKNNETMSKETLELHFKNISKQFGLEIKSDKRLDPDKIYCSSWVQVPGVAYGELIH